MGVRPGSALATVRCGHSVAAIHDLGFAERHIESLSAVRTVPGAEDGPTLKTVAREAAPCIFGILVASPRCMGRQ